MKKICFVALGAYPILSRQKSQYFIGGSELQQVLIGKELVKNGYDITFIDYDHGQEDIEIIEGIKVLKISMKSFPNSLSDYLKHFNKIFRTLSQADSDIYLQRGGIFLIPLIFCKLNRRKLFFSVPSDSFVSDEKIHTLGMSWFYLFLKKKCITLQLKNADLIIVQSEYQKRKLEDTLKVKSILIKNIIELKKCRQIDKDYPPVVLWVSSIKKIKQPEIFLELAKKLPEHRFLMIGGPADDMDYYINIEKQAKKISNLSFLGFIPFDEIAIYFSKATILINTSIVEGFPNTFIQAWSCNTPVISLNVDPDQIINKNKLGYHSKTFDCMIKNTISFLTDDNLRDEMGNNGYHYVVNNHSQEYVIKKYISLIEM